MKIFTNLPGNLRAFFAFLRISTIVMGFYWLLSLVLSFSPLGDESPGKITLGEAELHFEADAVRLKSNEPRPEALALSSLRGTLQAKLGNQNAEMKSALWKTVIPSMMVTVLFSYVLLTSLRNLCANIEAGEIFCAENIRLVRGIGMNLVVYSLVNAAVGLWASAIMGRYLRDHVLLKSGLEFTRAVGTVQFSAPQGLISFPLGLVMGSLVLVLAEAFRQGLNLKAENDLTV